VTVASCWLCLQHLIVTVADRNNNHSLPYSIELLYNKIFELQQTHTVCVCDGWASCLTRNSSGDEIVNMSFFCGNIFNHFYAVRLGSYQIRWNNAKYVPLCRSRSFKVTNFRTNQKLIYDFLLVINTNLPPILHCFWDIAFDRSKIATFGCPSWI